MNTIAAAYHLLRPWESEEAADRFDHADIADLGPTDVTAEALQSPMPHAAERRADLFAVLERHEEDARFALDTQSLALAVDRAFWRASWNLRMNVASALDACEKAEAEARWARDE